MNKFSYYKTMKGGEIDGLKVIDNYKIWKETELISCFETYISYGKNHIKLSLLSNKDWVEINYNECCDILTEKEWGTVCNSSTSISASQGEG